MSRVTPARVLVPVALAVVLLAAAGSQAALRAFTVRYSANLKGNFVFVGNTLMTCPDADPKCAGARAGTNLPITDDDNNVFTMGYVDVDGDPTTFDSSQADLNLPAGSTVTFAGLYWGADTSAGVGGAAAPSAASLGTVLFTPPGGPGATVTASQLDTSGTRYQGFADVTAAVSAAGNGAYTLADVQAGTGQDRYAGWSLVVVYANNAETTRNVTVFDGFQIVNSPGTPSIDLPVSGFLTPPSGPVDTRLGVLTYEGDLGLVGDSLQLGPNTSALTTMSDAQNPATNLFNSTISSLATLVTTKSPNYVNQLGLDADVVDAAGILPNGSSSAVMRLMTAGDTFFPGAVVFATQLFAPDLLTTIAKSGVDLNGGSLRPGDTVRYTVSFSNVGSDSATNVVLDDPIPAGTTYVPGSLVVASGANAGAKTDAAGDDQAEFDGGLNRVVFRLGSGADASSGGSIAPAASTSIAFDVVVDPSTADGTSVLNTADLDYDAATLGTAYSGSVSSSPLTVVNQAALSITKVASPTSYQAGSPLSYTITVSNSGPSDVSGATVTDTVPAALSGFAWSCSPTCSPASGTGDVSTSVDVSASGSATITLSGTVPNGTTGSIVNTASVAPPAGVVDPNNADNSATSTTLQSASADLSITKTASGSTYVPGSPLTYTITVSNAGPADVTGATVTDVVPAALSTFTWACAAGCTPASGTGSISTAVDVVTGSSRTITLTGTVPHSTSGAIVNTATVATPAGVVDPNGANNTATRTVTKSGSPPPSPTPSPPSAQEAADVNVTKTGPPTANVGDTISFTLAVSNAGPDTATSVVATDTLPSQFDYVDSTAGCSIAGQVVTCIVAALPSGARASFVVRVRVTAGAGGSATNRVVVSAPTADPNVSNNSASVSVAIGSPPPPPPKPTPKPKTTTTLDLTKRWLAATVRAGATARATIVVENTGGAAAVNVTVCDRPPRNTTFVSAPGAYYRNGSGCWRIARLAPHERRVFTVTLRVDRTAKKGQATNVATASAANVARVAPARAIIHVKPARRSGRPGGVTG